MNKQLSRNQPIEIEERPGLIDQILEATRKHAPRLTIAEKLTLAENMAKAGVFPSASDQYKAFAAIEIGQALGMEPGIALMSIDFGAQGKPSISVHWQAGKAQELGWRWEFLAHNAATCHMRFYPPNGRGQAFEMKFSMDEAKSVLIYDREQASGGDKKAPATLGNKWNYKSWAADMLYAFVMRRFVRRYEPRILGGYAGTEDEEAEEAIEIGAYEGARPTKESADQAAKELFGQGGVEVVDKRTGEITHQEEREAYGDTVTPTMVESDFSPQPEEENPAEANLDSDEGTIEPDMPAVSQDEYRDKCKANGIPPKALWYMAVDMQRGPMSLPQGVITWDNAPEELRRHALTLLDEPGWCIAMLKNMQKPAKGAAK